MSLEDTSSAILNFLSKFIEKDNWIFLSAVTLACIAGIYSYSLIEYKEVWWLISIGIFSASILVLKSLKLVISNLYRLVCGHFQKVKEKRKIKKKQLADEELAKISEERKNARVASDIWALVQYSPIEHIEEALTFFDLPLSDGNTLIRYLAPAKDAWCEEYQNYKKIYRTQGRFTFHNNRIRLMAIDSSSGHDFVKIDMYFYNLLSHYAKTGKWEKLGFSGEIAE